MKTLYFNRQTLLGEVENISSIFLDVEDSFELSKCTLVPKGKVQKENENGEKIYLKPIYEITPFETFVGYDETIEETEEPCIISKQKEDEEGNLLFTENIYNEEGEIVDTFTTTKTHNEDGTPNEPIIEYVPKLSDSGKPLYLKPIYSLYERKELLGYEETTEVTDSPCMIDNLVEEYVILSETPEHFSINEVLTALYQETLDSSMYDYVVGDMFLNEDDLDLTKSYANTGVGILHLPPKGYAVTKPITLEKGSNTFKFAEPLPEGISAYINTKKVVNNEVTLANNTSKLTIKFVNNNDYGLDLKSYVILY